MSFQIQLGTKPQGNVHPVVWVFAHARSEMSSIDSQDAASLLSEPTAACRKWIEATPILSRWFNSDQALTAAHAWPSSIVGSFGVPYPPTPFELANAVPTRARDPIVNSDSAKVVVAFACGIPYSVIAEALGTGTGVVMDMLTTGARELGRNPRFAVWASNVDFNKSAFSLTLPKPLTERIVSQEKLADNPLLADEEDVEFLMASPLFVAAVRAGTLPRRQGYRQMRPRAIVRPPRTLE